MAGKKRYASHDEYFDSVPPEVRPLRAAFKRHIGVYPPIRSDAGLIEELARYRGEKGNLSFPVDEPMPWDLIRRVASTLAQESRVA